MTLNFALLALLAALVAAAVIVAIKRLLPSRLGLIAIAGFSAAMALLILRTHLRLDTEALIASNPDHPAQNPTDGYVSSSQCKACHPREYSTWHASFHRTMTQRPTAQSVAAVFGVGLKRGDERFDLIQNGDRYEVDMPVPEWWSGPSDAGRIRRPVALMTGSHNYQVYWTATGSSRVLAQLPYVYLIAEQMWMPRSSVFMIPPSNRVLSEYGRWNVTCIQCHSTSGRPKVEGGDAPKTAETEVAEYGIACEACHGPAGEHVAVMQNPLRRYGIYFGLQQAAGIVHPGKLDATRSVYVCGQCHSVHSLRVDQLESWNRSGFNFRPGADMQVSFGLLTDEEARADSEHFWPDGMVRVTGREMNSVLDSPCFAGGKFTCLSCHEPHQQASDPRTPEQWRDAQLKPFAEANGTCTQCHAALRAEAAVAKHTRHAPQSTGSACVNCHMPYTVYGLAKLERSHEISSPDVKTDLETGRPNACNLCHIDRTLAWSAERLASWYGVTAPVLGAEEQEIAGSLLALYRGDANQRALAIWNMGWETARATAGDDWVTPHLVRALDDPYEVLGLVAWRALRKIHGEAPLPGRILMTNPTWRSDQARKTLKWNPARPDTHLLIGPDGDVDPAAVAPLLAKRNNRPVTLSE